MNFFNPISGQAFQPSTAIVNRQQLNPLQNNLMPLANIVDGVAHQNFSMQTQMGSMLSFSPLNPMTTQFLHPNPFIFSLSPSFISLGPSQFHYFPYSEFQLAPLGLDQLNASPIVQPYPPEPALNNLSLSSNFGERDFQSPAGFSLAAQPLMHNGAEANHLSTYSNLGPRDSLSPTVVSLAAQPSAYNGAVASHSSPYSNLGPRDSQSPAAVSLVDKSSRMDSHNPNFPQAESVPDPGSGESLKEAGSVLRKEPRSCRKRQLPPEVTKLINEENENQKILIKRYKDEHPKMPFPHKAIVSSREIRYILYQRFSKTSLLQYYKDNMKELELEKLDVLEDYVNKSAASYKEHKKRILNFHTGNSNCGKTLRKPNNPGVLVKRIKKRSPSDAEIGKLEEIKNKWKDLINKLFEEWYKNNEKIISKTNFSDLSISPYVVELCSIPTLRVLLNGYQNGVYFQKNASGEMVEKMFEKDGKDLLPSWKEFIINLERIKKEEKMLLKNSYKKTNQKTPNSNQKP